MTSMAFGLTSSSDLTYTLSTSNAIKNTQKEMQLIQKRLVKIKPIHSNDKYPHSTRSVYVMDKSFIPLESYTSHVVKVNYIDEMQKVIPFENETSKLIHFNEEKNLENVFGIQQKLHALGYYNSKVDGIYHAKTKEALKHYQKDHNLTVNGLLDSLTLNHIKAIKVIVKSPNQITNERIFKGSFINKLKTLIGTPYVWGGSTPTGFDCSGFIYYAYRKYENITLPRTASDLWNHTIPVKIPKIGDLVFFETYKPGPSHVGVYIGNDLFIHAGSDTGVTISNMYSSYWEKKLLGIKRISQ
jgi:cell wall-associated NlpC family hydrolase